jgi:hypothetical protein
MDDSPPGTSPCATPDDAAARDAEAAARPGGRPSWTRRRIRATPGCFVGRRMTLPMAPVIVRSYRARKRRPIDRRRRGLHATHRHLLEWSRLRAHGSRLDRIRAVERPTCQCRWRMPSSSD